MIDPRLLRENPDAIREALKRRNTTLSLDPLLALEQQRRELLAQIERRRQELNQGSLTD